MAEESRTALVCIDLQKEYFSPGGPLLIPDGAAVRANVEKLQAAAREQGQPIIHVRHINRDPLAVTFRAGSGAVDFAPGTEPLPGEETVTKVRPGAFYLTELGDLLKRAGADTVIICGLMSFMCCDTTAQEARARGYRVLFVRDATAAMDLGDIPAETVHRVVCAIQAGFFAQVVDTEEAIRSLDS